MSKDGKDGLMPCLFSRQGMTLDNVKFFRGEAKVIAESDFRNAFCDAEARKVAGAVTASNLPPSTGVEAVDVRAWVAAM